MSNLAFLKANPDLKILLNSKLLDIIPGGFSIATDSSCKSIIHNRVAAEFLRIEPWGQFSHSSQEPPAVTVLQNGKILRPEEMPIQYAVLNGEEIIGQELEFIWEDGVSKIARWNATPLRDDFGTVWGCFSTMEDITELVHMTRELDKYKSQLEHLVEEKTSQLKASEERFAKIFFSSPHAMSINRKSDFTYLEVNNQWLKNSKLCRDDVIGKKPLDIGIPENEYENFVALFNEQGSVVNMENSLIKDYSIAGTVLISAEPILLNGEECILFASNDITEMKRLQSEMARLDRFDLIGQMAAGIGHEIRNPMTVVRGYLQLLGSRPDYKQDLSVFESMIEEIDRANSIITEYLSLAKDKPSEILSQNIAHIVGKLYPLIEADAYAQNKQMLVQTNKVPNTLLDRKEITQLILNLCRNGLESMPVGGTLRISTYFEDQYVHLSIQDEGCGIPPEHLGKLGTPFFTTKDSGTGLGLAISYRIADRHQAKMHVESGPTGTNFVVSFPAV